MKWYSYKGEATWNERTEGDRRTADFVMPWRVIAQNATDASTQAYMLVKEARGEAPNMVRVLEVFELEPSEARVLNDAELVRTN